MKTGRSIGGVVVPMVSPLSADRLIDHEMVQRVVDHLIEAGVAGVFVLGTTGEAGSLSDEQKRSMVEAAGRAVAGRAKMYAGVSANTVAEAVDAARHYRQFSVDVAVAHAPFDRSVPATELRGFFARLADASPLPLVLYNMPMVVGVSISIDDAEWLSAHPNILGIKDSENSWNRIARLIATSGGKPDFSILVGCAALSANGLKHGAHGIVPSAANLWPRPYQALYDASLAGAWDEVDRLQAHTNALVARFQDGRALGDSLAVLKTLMAEQLLSGSTVLASQPAALGGSA